jgi:hypothetical protein
MAAEPRGRPVKSNERAEPLVGTTSASGRPGGAGVAPTLTAGVALSRRLPPTTAATTGQLRRLAVPTVKHSNIALLASARTSAAPGRKNKRLKHRTLLLVEPLASGAIRGSRRRLSTAHRTSCDRGLDLPLGSSDRVHSSHLPILSTLQSLLLEYLLVALNSLDQPLGRHPLLVKLSPHLRAEGAESGARRPRPPGGCQPRLRAQAGWPVGGPDAGQPGRVSALSREPSLSARWPALSRRFMRGAACTTLAASPAARRGGAALRRSTRGRHRGPSRSGGEASLVARGRGGALWDDWDNLLRHFPPEPGHVRGRQLELFAMQCSSLIHRERCHHLDVAVNISRFASILAQCPLGAPRPRGQASCLSIDHRGKAPRPQVFQ